MINVLLVEDDETIAMGVQYALGKEGFGVCSVSTIEAARVAFARSVDLVILDLNLPDGSGYDFCRDVRKRSKVPVIFLTVRDEDEDMIRGLDMGADDYITKPFKIKVLLSRIQAVLRRVTRDEKSPLLSCGDLTLDREKTKVYKGGLEVVLTKSEYKLLLLLMENKDCTVTRERILDFIWGVDGEFVNNNTLTVTMKRLREKIRDGIGDDRKIQTLRGIGYRMEGANDEQI